MPRWLITGGAGFVGSNLAVGLKTAHPDAQVLALDNLHRRGAEQTLPRLAAAGVEFRHGDVRIPGDLDEAGPFDFLIECSAEPSVLAGAGGDPDFLIQSNLIGALNCAQLCRRRQAPLLFLSTSRVYPLQPLLAARYDTTPERFELSDSQTVPGLSREGVAEDFPLEGARSLYGGTKYAAEIMLREFQHAYGLPVVINRCGVLAGPWQFGKVDQGIAAFWVKAHREGLPLQYIGFGGQGQQVRDMLHVADLLDLVLLQLAAPERFAAHTWNVGGGRRNSVSLRELTALCRDVTGRSTAIGSEAATRYADIPIFITDSRRLQAECGWQPRRSVRDIVADIARWLDGQS